jgi:hypothetical protein
MTCASAQVLTAARARPASFGRRCSDAFWCPFAQLALPVADQHLEHVVVLKHDKFPLGRGRSREAARVWEHRGAIGPLVTARPGDQSSGGAPGSGSEWNGTEGAAEQHRHRALLVEAVNHRHPLRSPRHTADSLAKDPHLGERITGPADGAFRRHPAWILLPGRSSTAGPPSRADHREPG